MEVALVAAIHAAVFGPLIVGGLGIACLRRDKRLWHLRTVCSGMWLAIGLWNVFLYAFAPLALVVAPPWFSFEFTYALRAFVVLSSVGLLSVHLVHPRRRCAMLFVVLSVVFFTDLGITFAIGQYRGP